MAKKTDPGKKRIGSSWKLKGRPILDRLADSSLPEIAFITTFILAGWWQNSDFIYPSEVWLPIAMFAVLASLVFYAYRLVLGKGLSPHLASLLLTYSLYNYRYVYDQEWPQQFLRIIPRSWSTDFTEAVVLGLSLAIIYGLLAWGVGWLIRRFEPLRHLQLYKVLLFAILFMFGVQIFKTGDRLVAVHEAVGYHYPAPRSANNTSAVASKPDIYYLLFDRYANADILKSNFNYDNSDMMNFLEEKGFVSRQSAHSNYPFTMSSVSSTMAMNYFPDLQRQFSGSDWQAAFAYRDILKNPPIAQILKQNGYQYNQVSSWWDFTRLGVKADSNQAQSFRLTVLGHQLYLSDFQRDLVYKSVFSQWLKKGLTIGQTKIAKYDLDRNPRENFESQMEALKNIGSRPNKSTPAFTFAHILAPHPPYVFAADGSWPTYDNEANDNGVDEAIKYTNETTYVNNRLKTLINVIQKQSPNALIILQADEGPYPKQFRGEMTKDHYYDPQALPLPMMKQKFSILASYYMPGTNAEKVSRIDASVNVFRFVLNNYLGYNLPMLPDCQFSTGSKFNLYRYHLVTPELTGKPAAEACKDYYQAQ